MALWQVINLSCRGAHDASDTPSPPFLAQPHLKLRSSRLTSPCPYGQWSSRQVLLPEPALSGFLVVEEEPSLSQGTTAHVPILAKNDSLASRTKQLAFALPIAGLCLVAPARAQTNAPAHTPPAKAATPAQQRPSNWRLLTLKEGRSIVNAAWQQGEPPRSAGDCSHLAHDIYQNAGFDYPYQSSSDLYAGIEHFQRVKFPHPGDLIVWPGHVGIVVDPLLHSFYSLVRTGIDEQDYESSYWRSRGTPRFYRYKVPKTAIRTAATLPLGPKGPHQDRPPLSSVSQRSPSLNRPLSADTVPEPPSPDSDSSSRPSPKAALERIAVTQPPAVSADPADPPTPVEPPSSIVVSPGNRLPTRDEVARGISELSDASAGILRNNEPAKIQPPVMIVEQLRLKRLDIKGDHGWAHVEIDSKVSIEAGAVQVKRRHTKALWELRRTDSGWEALSAKDRTYVPQDVALKHLAAQLAQITQSDRGALTDPAILQQESQLVQLLNGLLVTK